MNKTSSLPTVARASSESEYQPISGIAVAAIVMAGFATIVIVCVALYAIVITKKPVMNIALLLLAVAGVVLSIAARVHIRRSNGTRAGIKIVNAAWWMSVLSGVGFGAYYCANVVALRQQSEAVVSSWLGLLKEQQFDRAFLLTVYPIQRQNIDPANSGELDARFGANQLPTFRNSDLVRFFQRNGDAVGAESLGMSNSEQIDNGFRVDLSYRLKSAEGLFDLNLALISQEGPKFNGREWQIGVPEGLVPKNLTTYGRLVAELQKDAQQVAVEWMDAVHKKEWDSNYFQAVYDNEAAFKIYRDMLENRKVLQSAKDEKSKALASVFDRQLSENILKQLFRNGFFKLEGAEFLTEEKKKTFTEVWNLGHFQASGSMRLQNPDRTPLLTVKDDKIECEIYFQAAMSNSPLTFTKAKLVLICDSNHWLSEMHDWKAKGQANPAAADELPKGNLPLESWPKRFWRVSRFESNLEPLQQSAKPRDQ